KILCHALRYKNVSKVVYSTCSIHREENEDVVAYCLERNTDFKIEYIDIKNLLGNDKNHINIDMHEKSDLLDFNAKYEHKKQLDSGLKLQSNYEIIPDIILDEENVIEKENKYKVYGFENKILRIEKNEDENIQGFFVALFVRR
ncbi:putative 28S rRNA (cytosine-C(5))-methyltransferase, partial [Conglomerata obtusa]